MRSVAAWCAKHRFIVIAAWVLAVTAATIAHAAAGSVNSDNFTLRGTGSSAANALIDRVAPAATGDTDQLVLAVRHGRVTDPADRAAFGALIRRVERLPHVVSVLSPYAAPAQIAADGRTAFAQVHFDLTGGHFPGHEATRYDALITRASTPDLTFAADGGVAADGNPGGSSGGIAVGSLAAALVLFLVFGSLAATLLPLLTAGLSLGTGLALIGLLSHVVATPGFAGELALLIGMGVGVDYALFIVTRYRQARLRGITHLDAIVESLDTCGRAVLFAGAIVCVAMLGMFLLGVGFLYGVALAAAIVVAATVAAALTLLPALLSLFGDRTLRRSERRQLAAGTLRPTDESRGWARWAARLDRHPRALAVGAVALMLVLAVPFGSMRLGAADPSSDPAHSITHRAYDLLARGFGPGYNGPLELVAAVTGPAERAQFSAAVDAVGHTRGVAHVSVPTFLARPGDPTLQVGLATVTESAAPESASTDALLTRLREAVLPSVTRADGVQILVTGSTAVFADFAAVLTAKLPLFIGIVVLVSALLLMMVFRSILIPITAAVMNLLSTAAALGIVTAIFQWGWGGSLLDLQRGPIEAFLPVLMFPILFGLSMDYEVFLVARIHEEWHRRGCTRLAVSHGLAATGRTITAAAAIMVLVFAAFVLGGQRIIDMFGIGLASAVLFDALIIRAVVVPAAMLVLGEANWHLPARLEARLPRCNVEGARRAQEPDPA